MNQGFEIGQYKDGELIATYPSASEAARKNGLNLGNVCAVARGRGKTVKGYSFKYLELPNGNGYCQVCGRKDELFQVCENCTTKNE